MTSTALSPASSSSLMPPAGWPGRLAWLTVALSCLGAPILAQGPTFAERLGFPKGTRAIILHVDDVGMSHDSNVGAMRAIEHGAANSLSVMMPCSWVPEFVHHLAKSPELDAGLHLTLTSEWDEYRWGPLAGRDRVPGLVDAEGALWKTVEQVVLNASADEVETEIRAQLRRAREMGFEPTHLDSHMGTLFATPGFLERYLKVGAEEGIPVMFPGGHDTFLERQYREDARAQLERAGRWKQGDPLPEAPRVATARAQAETVWGLGLPVLDDLHNTSYGWRPPKPDASDDELRELKVARYVEALRSVRPGVTMIIMHATDPSENFPFISSSGPTRKGDMLAMLDPRVAQTIAEEGLVLTTFRELMERRRKVE